MKVANRYEVIKSIGRGGWGKVYLVKDLTQKENPPLALKLIPSNISQGELLRLKQEFYLLSHLSHPNILKVFDFGETQKHYYFTMEYIDGKGFNKYFSKGLKKGIEDSFFDAIFQLLSAIQYIHHKGLVHRDLKPTNILITKENQVKLLDFGFSESVRGFSEIFDFSVASDIKGFKGTLGYTAPEVLKQERVDLRTDLYSLGVILYETLTHQLPFDGDNPLEIIRAQLERDPSPPQQVNPHIPPALSQIVMRLLEKYPNDRYLSSEEVFETLLAYCKLQVPDYKLRRKYHAHFNTPQIQIFSPPLIAREKELIQFQNLIKRAKEGTGGVVLLSGERGVGKSRLLKEFKFHGQLKGFQVLTGMSSDTDKRPFLPIRQIIMQLPMESKLPIDAKKVESKFPDEVNKWRMFEEVKELFRNHPNPLILIIDDLHLTDSLTQDLTAFLARSLCKNSKVETQEANSRKTGVIIVVAYESTSVETPVSFLEGFRIIDDIIKIHLNTLSSEETESYLLHLLPNHEREIQDNDFRKTAKWLHRQTGGNPLLIEETTKLLISEGIIERIQKRWIFDRTALGNLYPLKHSIEIDSLIAQTLSRLDEKSKRVIEEASIIGDRFSIQILKELISLSDKELFPLLNHLEREHLLVRNANDEGFYSFTHHWLKHILYEKIDSGRRRKVHRKILKILEKKPVNGNEMDLAYHSLHGALPKKYFKYGKKAGEVAERSYNHRRASDLYEKLLPHVSDKNERLKLFEKLGDLNENVGEYDKSLAHYSHALQIMKGTQYGLIVPRIYLKLGTLEMKKSRYPEALQYLEKGLSLLKVKNTSIESNLLNSLGQVYTNQGYNEKAVKILLRAEAISHEIQDGSGLALSLLNLSTVYRKKADFKAAITLAEKGLSIAMKNRDNFQIASAYNKLGLYYWNHNELEEAKRFYLKCLKLREKIGDLIGIGAVHLNLGMISHKLGNREIANKHYETSLNIFEKLNDTEGLSILYINFGYLLFDHGRWDKVSSYFLKSLELAKKMRNRFKIANAHRSLGRLYFYQYELVKAEKELTSAVLIDEEIGSDEGVAIGLVDLARIEMERENWNKVDMFLDKAGKIYEEKKINWSFPRFLQTLSLVQLKKMKVEKAQKIAEEAIKVCIDTEDIGFIYRTLGMVYAKKGEDDKAYENFLKSRKILENADFRYELGLTLFEFARYHVLRWQKNKRSDSFHSACNLLTRAEKVFSELGAKGEVEKINKTTTHLVAQLSAVNISFGREDQLKTLYEVSQVINSILDFETLMHQLIELVINVLKAERGVLLLKENGKLRVVSGTEIDNTTISDATKLSKSILQQVSKEGAHIISTDALNDPRFKRKESVILNKIHSLICVPIRLKEKVIGTFYVDSRIMKGLFSVEDVSFLNALSNFLAVVIENARFCEELRQEADYLREEVGERYKLGNLIGKSDSMQKVFNQIEIFSKSDASVLIEGETGTGKELVARAIHYNGQRRDNRFIPVECGALPETLAESELFGHKKGTFTDAKEDKIGIFEEADGGTIFLDQIDNLSSKVQAKLLRVLQDGEVRRLGETKARKVDVRIIVAANKDLKEEVRQRRFRDDLYFRLNTLYLYLAPLRERREDISILIGHFLDIYSEKTNKRIKGISKKALDHLLSSSWPGNIRELEHVIEKGVTLTGNNGLIKIESLLDQGRKTPEDELDLIPEEISLKEAVVNLEKRMIQKALERCNWNITKASESLGLTREGLRKKINRYKFSKTK
jgi:Nif-specific regulatory protein